MASSQVFVAQMGAVSSGQSVVTHRLLLKDGLTQHGQKYRK